MHLKLKPIAQNHPDEIVVLLIPNFSLLPFSSLIEPLRMANYISRQTLYRYRLISTDGKPVRSSGGIEVSVDSNLSDAGHIDNLFVCSGLGAHMFADKTVFHFLQRISRSSAYIGGICTATHIMAYAGILNGHRCTIHWENLDALREGFPALDVTTALYEQDGNRLTCCGSTSALEMMLNIIGNRHGPVLARSICEQFIYEKTRMPDENSALPLRIRLQVNHPRLVKAISIMETNCEEIIPRQEIASQVGISCRQLERLFNQHIGSSPRRYYLKLRLARAQRLLTQTRLSVAEIAFVSGFNTASHFSRCFRAIYGFTPRANRNR